MTGVERHRLRGSFGWELWSRRAGRGWTQAVLAARAGVTETSVRELERGQVRPSDAMCTKLARALEDGHDDLTVAMTDVTLRRAAGASLRVWQRRRPPRAATQRLYAAAQEVLDARARERSLSDDTWWTAFERGLSEPPPEPEPRSPADAWPDRWPRVK